MADDEYRALAQRLRQRIYDDEITRTDVDESATAILELLDRAILAESTARENAASAVTAYGQAEENFVRAVTAETRLGKAKEALKFYADPGEWQARAGRTRLSDGWEQIPDFYADLDFGYRARTVLSELEKSE